MRVTEDASLVVLWLRKEHRAQAQHPSGWTTHPQSQPQSQQETVCLPGTHNSCRVAQDPSFSDDWLLSQREILFSKIKALRNFAV